MANTIDIQKLKITPQDVDNTYIGIDENGQLIRTKIELSGTGGEGFKNLIERDVFPTKIVQWDGLVEEYTLTDEQRAYNIATYEMGSNDNPPILIWNGMIFQMSSGHWNSSSGEGEVAFSLVVGDVNLMDEIGVLQLLYNEKGDVEGTIKLYNVGDGSWVLSNYYTKDEVNAIVSNIEIPEGNGDVEIRTLKYQTIKNNEVITTDEDRIYNKETYEIIKAVGDDMTKMPVVFTEGWMLIPMGWSQGVVENRPYCGFVGTVKFGGVDGEVHFNLYEDGSIEQDETQAALTFLILNDSNTNSESDTMFFFTNFNTQMVNNYQPYVRVEDGIAMCDVVSPEGWVEYNDGNKRYRNAYDKNTGRLISKEELVIASSGGGDVDLTGYATEEYVDSHIEPLNGGVAELAKNVKAVEDTLNGSTIKITSGKEFAGTYLKNSPSIELKTINGISLIGNTDIKIEGGSGTSEKTSECVVIEYVGDYTVDFDGNSVDYIYEGSDRQRHNVEAIQKILSGGVCAVYYQYLLEQVYRDDDEFGYCNLPTWITMPLTYRYPSHDGYARFMSVAQKNEYGNPDDVITVGIMLHESDAKVYSYLENGISSGGGGNVDLSDYYTKGEIDWMFNNLPEGGGGNGESGVYTFLYPNDYTVEVYNYETGESYTEEYPYAGSDRQLHNAMVAQKIESGEAKTVYIQVPREFYYSQEYPLQKYVPIWMYVPASYRNEKIVDNANRLTAIYVKGEDNPTSVSCLGWMFYADGSGNWYEGDVPLGGNGGDGEPIDLSNYYTKTEIDDMIGDINNILETI